MKDKQDFEDKISDLTNKFQKAEFEARKEYLLKSNLLHQIKEAYESPDGRSKVFIFEDKIVKIPYSEIVKYAKMYSLSFFDRFKIKDIFEQNREFSLLKCLEAYFENKTIFNDVTYLHPDELIHFGIK